MTTVSQTFADLRSVRNKLHRFRDEDIPEGIRQGMRRYAKVIIKRHFNSRQNDVRRVKGWPPLADSTRAQKTSPFMLRESGEMQRSIIRSAKARISRRTLRGKVSWNPVRYAAFHEQGRGVPRRVWSEPTPREREMLEEWAERYLVNQARRKFRRGAR